MPSCLVHLLLFLLLPKDMLGSAQFSVIGPDKPILALVGGDAELSCHLNPKRSAEHMEIKWLQSQSLNIIHLYDNGQDNNNVQMDKYQGRTELVRNDIKEGRLALRISEVRATDDGQYLCIFNEGPLSEETTLELQVAEMGSDPHIRLVGHEDGRIRLECSSAGWYPEPQVLWRDAREETFPSLSKALSQTADGLFGVAASVIIQEGSMGTVSCSVQNSCLSREKISAFISISAPFFHNAHPWMVALALILTALGLIITGGLYLIWKLRKEKEEECKGRKNQVIEAKKEREEKERTQKINGNGTRILLFAPSPAGNAGGQSVYRK
ncbi:butyrophilin subfamily 1 member A1-like [Ornithorhynchus anatinus]|uniref:butyrophilin subfamily 1 member A1-like n=1 Tax=Ornithorhynchus anatinus TaxID=9258 RepID=UPI0019D4BF21|nr:butyrophilin subfamily 1 member A1-like [Ornithorhynchus anatinus]